MDQYTQDNTQGYSQAELDALNNECASRLFCAAVNKGDDLTPDEIDAIIKRHADDVAGR